MIHWVNLGTQQDWKASCSLVVIEVEVTRRVGERF